MFDDWDMLLSKLQTRRNHKKTTKRPQGHRFVAFNATYGLLGAYWFEKAGKRSLSMLHVIVTSSKFWLSMISMMIYLKPSAGQLRMAWLLQHRAPPHSAHDSIAYWKRFSIFASLTTDHEWVPYSPDLNLLEFWLLEAAKQTVFPDKPTMTLDDIK